MDLLLLFVTVNHLPNYFPISYALTHFSLFFPLQHSMLVKLKIDFYTFRYFTTNHDRLGRFQDLIKDLICCMLAHFKRKCQSPGQAQLYVR